MKRYILSALVCICLPFATIAKADDAPLLSPKRLSLAAQVGLDYQRPTDFGAGAQRAYAVKLVPSYNLFGHVGKSTGSVALNFPAKYVLGSSHGVELGAYLSIIIWSGKDLPAPKAQ